jgi:hypothetical protein
VTRTGNTGLAATIDYATADGTANSNDDYLARSGTLSFAPGEASKVIDVPILGNLEAPGSLGFSVALSAPTGAAVVGSVDSTTATIENHYSPVRFAATSYAVTTDVTSAVVTVSRTGNLAVVASVDYETADGTAEAGADYTAASGTLSFDPGESTKTITVPIAGRHDAASGLDFIVALTDTGGGAVLESAAQTTVTVNNPHAPIEFAATAYDTTTDALNVTVTVRRSGNTSGPVSVHYATVDGSAAAGTDYSAVSGTLNFAAGEVTETIVVPMLGNFASGPGSEFSLVLTSPSGSGAELGADDSAVVSIDNAHSVVQLEADAFNVDVRDGSVVIAVTRQGNLDLPASVDYATADGTATDGVDYYAASGILAFGPGESTQYITVTLLGDAGSAPSASFSLSLSSPDGNAELATPGGAIVTVENHQSLVQFDRTAYDVSADAGTATLVLTRTGNTALPATVDYATANGTAADGLDYTATSGTVTFLAGQTLRTIDVPVLVNLPGPAEVSFTVTLSNPTDSVVGAAGTIDVTVQNLYSVVGFESAAATFSGDDGVAGLVVRRTGNTSLAGAVSYATFSDTAVAGDDYVAASGVVNFAAGEVTKVLNVTLPGNPAAPTDRTFHVVLSNGTGAAVVGAADTATVTVTNVHSVVTFATTAYAAGESAGVVTVTLSRVGNLGRSISIAYATADGTASAGPDYLAAAGTVTFAEGQSTATVDLLVNSDLDFDPNETFSVSLSSPANGAVVGAAASAVVTLADTTPAPTFSGGGLVALLKPGRIDALSLTFDQALEGAPPASAFALYQRGGEKPGLAAKLLPRIVASTTYDPATHAVTVHSLKPLKSNRFYQLVVDPAAVRNLGGRPLDGAGNGQEGTPLVVTFGQGRKLTYVDSNGDTVKLSLKGPGVMQLVRGTDGDAERLTLSGTTSVTRLLGTVRPGRTSGDGHTTVGVLAGLGAATNLLTEGQFEVGALV